MENSVWRSRTETVAVVDMILVVIGFFWIVKIMRDIYHINFEIPESEHVTLWFLAGAIFLLYALKVWAVLMLWSATKKQDIQTAVRKVKIWMCVNVATFLLYFIRHIFSREYAPAAVGFVVMGLFLFVVYKFMKDLQRP